MNPGDHLRRRRPGVERGGSQHCVSGQSIALQLEELAAVALTSTFNQARGSGTDRLRFKLRRLWAIPEGRPHFNGAASGGGAPFSFLIPTTGSRALPRSEASIARVAPAHSESARVRALDQPRDHRDNGIPCFARKVAESLSSCLRSTPARSITQACKALGNSSSTGGGGTVTRRPGASVGL